MSATLKDLTKIRGNVPTFGYEAPSLDQVLNALGSTAREHNHDFTTAAQGTKIGSSGLIAGGHTAYSHATINDRIVPLNLGDWRVVGNDYGLPTTSTDPAISLASSAPVLTWTNGGIAGGTIYASAQVPDNYDQSIDTIAFHALARSAAAPATQAKIMLRADLVKPGEVITNIVAATAMTSMSTALTVEDVSKAIGYNTLAQQDVLSITLTHGAGGTAADIEFFGGWLEYTGEE